MLRDDQIDLRRERARAERYAIERLGKNRVFADYRVANPATGGQYTVTIRGFDLGDNACTCPDFKANTLGTCKHIEAVLEELREEQPERVRKRKAAITQPELFVHYGDELRIGIHAPTRRSDPLEAIVRRYFDADHLWNGEYGYDSLIAALDAVPELVNVPAGVYALIDADAEAKRSREAEIDWLWQLDRGELPAEFRDLVKEPLLAYQWRGAAFLASRPRSILADSGELATVPQVIAAAELLALRSGIGKVLVIAPASSLSRWQTEIARLTGRGLNAFGAADAFYAFAEIERFAPDLERINDCGFDLIVLDGALRLGTWESPACRAAKRLRSKYAIALADLSPERDPDALFAVGQFVDERRLGPAFRFFDDFRDADGKGIRNAERLREKLAPIFLRRIREDVKEELPAEGTSDEATADAAPSPVVDSILDFLERLAKSGRDLKFTPAQSERLKAILETLEGK